MKRLLLVTYEFPPKGGTQSQYAAKLAKGLAGRDWEVTVLTVADPPTALVDTALYDEVASSVRVVTAWSLEPTRLMQWLRRRRGIGVQPPDQGGAMPTPSATPRGYSGMPDWAVRLIQSVFVPDEKALWAPYAVRAAVKDARATGPYDLIVATGPPFTAYRIAWRVARRLRVPWVADLRDPIVGTPLVPASGPKAWLMRRFERTVARTASAVLASSETVAKSFRQRHPGSAGAVHTVPNGFDPADYAGACERDAGRFVVAHVGAFQGLQSPRDLFAGIVAASGEREGFRGDVSVRLVGPVDPDSAAAAGEFALSDVVDVVGFVPHAHAVREMRCADVLLQVIGPDPRIAYAIASKLPEYLAAGRPVICVAPADTESARIVARSGAGWVIEPGDAEAMRRALLELHDRWRDGALPVPNPAVVAEFDRDRLLDDLSARLREMVRDS